MTTRISETNTNPEAMKYELPIKHSNDHKILPKTLHSNGVGNIWK